MASPNYGAIAIASVLPAAVLMLDGARKKYRPWHVPLVVASMGIGLYVGRENLPKGSDPNVPPSGGVRA